ncbi:MAG: hypothetical protein EBZ74_04475 [Planctomycetia bacterium]|nr:hypothetical protein [Planctomycetia bacterium]
MATALTALAAAEPPAMRVESEVFVDRAAEPVSRSLTLFRDGLAWDFLDGAAPDAAGEIVLHDPARERLVVIDPARNVKTVVEAVRLDRLAASLASWARRSDDRLVRWAGGADFAEALVEKERKVELAGPRARYEVAYDTAPSPDAAERYGRFADAAILLRALLHPGGVPPFPRLALNRRIAAAGGIPTAVTLELDPRGGLVAGGPRVLRSVHKFHPRLLAADLDRLEDAEARVAVAEEVDLAAYAEPATARPVTAAK